MQPTPAYFFDHKNLRALGEKLVALESQPSLGNLVGTAIAGIKG
jgi:hypothetical protein